MAKIHKVTCKNLTEFIDSIRDIRQSAKNGHVWYRGHGDNSYTLKPTLFRNDAYSTIEGVIEVESRMMDAYEFGVPTYEHLLGDCKWDRLFLMQHYRMPTRLLDWTASPLVAAFFALKTVPPIRKKAQIWSLIPDKWNQAMVSDLNQKEKVFNTKDHFIDQYHPETSGVARLVPVAIEGSLSNPRINAQRGKFVIFGNSLKDMKFYANSKLDDGGKTLSCIDIPRSSIKGMFEELNHLGITHASVFPDLDGLAQEIAFKHGY